jgi:hypothetical protein
MMVNHSESAMMLMAPSDMTSMTHYAILRIKESNYRSVDFNIHIGFIYLTYHTALLPLTVISLRIIVASWTVAIPKWLLN